MKPEVESQTRLELRIVSNCTIRCQGSVIELTGKQDAAVLVLATSLGCRFLDEQIVAVTTDVNGFMALRTFVQLDGGITLHRNIA